MATLTTHHSHSKDQKRRWFEPKTRIHTWLTGYLPEPLVLLFYAVLVGVVGGYGAVGFRKLIDVFTALFFGAGLHVLSPLGKFAVLFLPLVGLFVVSIIVKFFAPEARGHGVPEVMAAIAENGSIIRPRVVIIKAIASALCIGSGGSGRPLVQPWVSIWVCRNAICACLSRAGRVPGLPRHLTRPSVVSCLRQKSF